ncbi:MAG: 16S rRNA (adenine(1518)-N(6)/adenine(1519)-N(6))-dimethyltransferase RsmA [Candidatus Omnitrophota bacterium]|jgi:16S rRNA (adenine1518-N6/adenine1519-N6)-dimethyltransferase
MRINPKKSLGQNFLADKNIVKKIIEALSLSPSDTVLEIGSGKGEITSLIASRVYKVYALELDARLKDILEERLKGYDNARVIIQDILKLDLAKLLAPKEKIKVFGNIPYYISSPIIEYLIRHRGRIERAFITVQKEFAKRVVASPGSKDYGSLSFFVQYYCLPEIIFHINRGCFYPVPKVDSSLLSLAFRAQPAVYVKDEELLFRLIRSAFNQRRKTLRNSLKGIAETGEIGAFLNQRPEDLSLEDFANLANRIS